MKRYLILMTVFITALCTAGSLFAFELVDGEEGVYYIDSPIPVTPTVMGQGGSFTANAKDYNSLFHNPAGFAIGDGEYTPLSVVVWAFLDYSQLDWILKYEEKVSRIEDVFEAWLTGGDISGVENFEDLQGEEIPDFDEKFVEENFESVYTAFSGVDPTFPVIADPSNPTPADIQNIKEYMTGGGFDADALNEEDYIDAAVDVVLNSREFTELLPSGNFTIGANLGLLGIVKNGFGMGLFGNVEMDFKGPSMLNTRGILDVTVYGVLGYSFSIGDWLSIGASVRPMYRAFGDIGLDSHLITDIAMSTGDPTNALLGALGGTYVYHGFGIGIDVGAIFTIDSFNIGVAVTDVYTEYWFNQNTLDYLIDYYENYDGEEGWIPDGDENHDGTADWEYEVYTPIDVSLGMSWHPQFEKESTNNLLDFELHAEVPKIVQVITGIVDGYENPYDHDQDGKTYDDAWRHLAQAVSVGANLKLISMINIAAGYHAGYLSLGLGLDVFFAEINAAIFFDPGVDFEEGTDYGASVEVAIRWSGSGKKDDEEEIEE